MEVRPFTESARDLHPEDNPYEVIFPDLETSSRILFVRWLIDRQKSHLRSVFPGRLVMRELITEEQVKQHIAAQELNEAEKEQEQARKALHTQKVGKYKATVSVKPKPQYL